MQLILIVSTIFYCCANAEKVETHVGEPPNQSAEQSVGVFDPDAILPAIRSTCNEGDLCHCVGTVQYGRLQSQRLVSRFVAGQYPCTNWYFGLDPDRGHDKWCYCEWAIPTCTIEYGVDYDLNDVQVASQEESAEACQARCTADDDCRYFSWATPQDPHNPRNCWLKTSPAGRRYHSSRTSGTKCGPTEKPKTLTCFVERDWDYDKNDIADRMTATSTESCQELCNKNPSCKYFSYQPSTRYCWLKSSNAGRTYKTDRNSGARCDEDDQNSPSAGEGSVVRTTCDEGDNCNCRGLVTYGRLRSGRLTVPQSIDGNYDCTNSFFKGDPDRGHDKWCYCEWQIPTCATEKGIDYVGNDIANINADSLFDCQRKCSHIPSCKFVSYATDGRDLNCWLKSNPAGRRSRADRESGARCNGLEENARFEEANALAMAQAPVSSSENLMVYVLALFGFGTVAYGAVSYYFKDKLESSYISVA